MAAPPAAAPNNLPPFSSAPWRLRAHCPAWITPTHPQHPVHPPHHLLAASLLPLQLLQLRLCRPVGLRHRHQCPAVAPLHLLLCLPAARHRRLPCRAVALLLRRLCLRWVAVRVVRRTGLGCCSRFKRARGSGRRRQRIGVRLLLRDGCCRGTDNMEGTSVGSFQSCV